MMEVAAESPQPAAWDQFKEEVEIMEAEGGVAAAAAAAAAAAGELLTREIKKRLLVHGHVNGGGAEELKAAPEVEKEEEEEEPKVAEEEQQPHKSIFFDAAKGLWKCRHCDWTYRLSSPCGNGTVDHRGYRHQIERNIESLVQKKGSFYGSRNKVPDIITEVSARYLVTGKMRSGDEKEDADETPSTKGKQLEAHENGNVQEINHGASNGKLENGSHSSGSHQVPDRAEPKIEYLFEINKTEIYPTEVDKDKHVTEAQPKVEEYDLEKILDQQETHDLFCPNCKSCITRRVILKKRKRTVRPANPDGPSKRLYTEQVLVPLPSATDEQESPDVFRCLSCFSFFIPAGCSFNIFRIFGRRDVDQVGVLPPPASEDTPPRSENCTSWLLSCFQPGDSPNQPHPADSVTVPLLSGAQSPNDTTTTTESSTSYVHHSHGTVVKPEHSITESSSEDQTTTTTTTTTTSATATTSSTTTSAAATIHSSSATGIFHSDVMEVITGEMPPPKPAGGVIMDATHHLLGHEDVHGTAPTTFENGSFTTHASHTSTLKVDGPNVTTIGRGDLPTSPNPQPADHVVVPVFGGVNPVAPRPQPRDDWDIPKAIVYGGLVESVTSLRCFGSSIKWSKNIGHIHPGHSQPYRRASCHLPQYRRSERHPRRERRQRAGRPVLAAARKAVESPGPHGPGPALIHRVRAASTGLLRNVVSREQRQGEQDDGRRRCFARLHRSACARKGACPDSTEDILQDPHVLPDHRRELVGAVVRRRRAHHAAPGAVWCHRARRVGCSCSSRPVIPSFRGCTNICLGLILKFDV